MLHHLGTFDVENYGDLLYPLVFRHLLKKKHANLQVRHYSLLSGDGPQEAGFETHSIRSLFKESPAVPRTLVIGGGDILRTDWDLVARHYGRDSRVSLKGLRHSIGTSGAVGYTLYQNLPRLEPGSFYARRFRARWMNYPAAGPFLISPQNLGEGSAVAYVSCGVPHEFSSTDRERVTQTLEQARFIGLRDEQSAEKLRRAGVRRELNVAPDLTVTLSDQFDRGKLARRGREILSQFEIGEDRPVLCFSKSALPRLLRKRYPA